MLLARHGAADGTGGRADDRLGDAGPHRVGRRRLRLLIADGSALAAFLTRPHERVLVDLGCGDGRATARLAAREPQSLVIGVDTNLDAAERVLRRTRRAPGRGGLPNLTFVLGSADRLPAELLGRVDELRIDLPWGSLLNGLLVSDRGLLAGLAEALAPGGQVRIVVNTRALPADLTPETAADRLTRGLASAGLTSVRSDATAVTPETGWGKRLAGRRPLPVVVAEARRPRS